MKELFDQLKSISDILNVGRLIFYTAAGALVIVPLCLLTRVMMSTLQPTFTLQLASDLQALGAPPVSVWVLFLASLVTGFLIAAVAFLGLQDRSRRIAQEVRRTVSDRTCSVTYNYPLLRQKKDEDYANWLVSEYSRYVEIVTFVPIGVILGLAVTAIYTATFLVRDLARTTELVNEFETLSGRI